MSCQRTVADAVDHGAGGAARRSGHVGAAEVFAAALDGNDRAELVGERTLGRAARQQLVKLPDGSGLLLSSTRYLTPKNEGIHEKRSHTRRRSRSTGRRVRRRRRQRTMRRSTKHSSDSPRRRPRRSNVPNVPITFDLC